MHQNGHRPHAVATRRPTANRDGGHLGVLFRLTYTEEEIRTQAYLDGQDDPGEQWALVRRLSFVDRAVIGAFPTQLRAAVKRAIGGEGVQQAMAQLSVEEMLGEAADLSAAACRIGFLRPRLVEREDEIGDDPNAWLVSDVHPDDRMAYLEMCLGRGSAAAERLMPLFRQPETPAVPAEAGDDGARLRGDPVPLDAAVGG